MLKHFLKKIERISYWRFVGMKKCFGLGAYPKYVKTSYDVPDIKTKPLILGEFFHDLLELINHKSIVELKSASYFNSVFNDLLMKYEDKISSNEALRYLGEIEEWPEISNIYNSVFNSFSSMNKEKIVAEREIFTEKLLKSNDELVSGKIDAFTKSGSSISLIDYKSGVIDKGSESFEDYKKQLYLYGYLIQENFKLYPTELGLIDQNMKYISIDPAPSISIQVAAEMKDFLQNYNSKIELDNDLDLYAKPNCETCKYCDLKPVCKQFWSQIHLQDFENFNHIVVGEQVGNIEPAKNSSSSVLVNVDRATIDSNEIKIGRLFMSRFPYLSDVPGQKLIFTNLRFNAETSNSAELCNWSQIIVDKING